LLPPWFLSSSASSVEGINLLQTHDRQSFLVKFLKLLLWLLVMALVSKARSFRLLFLRQPPWSLTLCNMH
jgi:hypothetical protein